jgi:pimeloyl-ACP methyl ester carboxylesterase
MTKPASVGVVEEVASRDGTRISTEKMGTGPSLVLVDGAFCGRSFGPARELAIRLADSFTVHFYDRRGRGDSGDSRPYSVAREIDDLHAVLAHAGNNPYVYGISSGAALALEAAAAGVSMRGLVTYEAPYTGVGMVDGRPVDHRAHLERLLSKDKRGQMVSYFLVKMVGAPAFVPLMLRLIPGVWKKQTASANTLPYETAILNDFTPPLERLQRITVPTMVMVGGKASTEMAEAQRAILRCIPDSEHRVLKGQTHQVAAYAIAPQLVEFFLHEPDFGDATSADREQEND